MKRTALLLALLLLMSPAMAGHDQTQYKQNYKNNPQAIQLQKECDALHMEHKQLEGEWAILKSEWENLKLSTGGKGNVFNQQKARLEKKKEHLMQKKQALYQKKQALEAKKQALKASKSY